MVPLPHQRQRRFGGVSAALVPFTQGRMLEAVVLSSPPLPLAGFWPAEGERAALVRDTFPGSDDFVQIIRDSIAGAGVTLLGEDEARIELLAELHEKVHERN